MIPAGTPLWAWAAIVTGVLTWAAWIAVPALIITHQRRETRRKRAHIAARLRALRHSGDWGHEPAIETRPGQPSADLTDCWHIWPDAPTTPREENER